MYFCLISSSAIVNTTFSSVTAGPWVCSYTGFFLRRLWLILNVSHSCIFCSCSQVSELITHDMFFTPKNHEKKRELLPMNTYGVWTLNVFLMPTHLCLICAGFGGGGGGPLAGSYRLLPHFIYMQSPAALVKLRRLCVVYFFFLSTDLTL